MPKIEQDVWVTVGRIRTVYGVKGWMKVESFTEPASNLLNYNGWRLVPDERALKPKVLQLDGVEQRQNDILVRLVGVENREDAKRFANHLIQVPQSELPALDAKEYYWCELQGLDVYQVDRDENKAQLIGRVESLLETGANDVLVVSSQAEGEILIPYLPETVVKRVDLDAGQIWVDWEYRD